MNKFIPNIGLKKFKKFRKNKYKHLDKIAHKMNQLSFGHFGLKSLQCGLITPVQIEACRRVISRKLKRKGKL
jgi:large subunit ribosomal protein L16